MNKLPRLSRKLNDQAKLHCQFQIISVAALLTITTLLGLTFKYSMNAQVQEEAAIKNMDAVHLFSGKINERTLASINRVSGDVSRSRRKANIRIVKKIKPVMDILLKRYADVEFEIYNLDGVVAYSKNVRDIGKYSSDEVAFKKAREGHSINWVDDKKPKIFVSIIPVYRDKTVSAVAKVYRNISAGLSAAKSQFNLVMWALLLTVISLHFMYSYYIKKIEKSLKEYEEKSHLQEEDQAFLSYHDQLTRLPNRELFIDRLVHAAAKVDRAKELLAVMFIDLDRFKLINDSLGYSAGNEIVKMVADRLKCAVRDCDTIARVGGDEFTILLETISDPQEAVYVVKRIQASLANAFQYNNQEINLSASIGISIYPKDEGKIEDLIHHADAAKDKAKKNGGSDFRFYTRNMNISSWGRLEMEQDLRHGIEKSQFILYFQPKVDLTQGRITGMEALLRWQRTSDELVSPAEFIPMLEETGLIIEVGEWVLRESCITAKRWMDQGYESMVMAVNVSARQFRQLDFVDMVYNILDETGLPPELLEIEVTEGILMEDTQASASTLEALKRNGIRIAIDDFGTGYSSLSYLQRYPIDTLKIDRAFVQDIENNSEGVAITTAIIALAHNLRLHIVAEGVETNKQLEFLTALGCQDIQGFLFSKPLPYAEFCKLLENEAQMFSDVFAKQQNSG